jgi:hypothetical protein
MIKEINKKETMNKTKSKKTTKKKTENKKEITTPKEAIAPKFTDVEGKFLHVKVGDANRPSTDDDIKLIQEQLTELFDKNNVDCLLFVTHHAIEIDIIEKLK